MLAVTATVTDVMRRDIVDKLDMGGCMMVSESPNKPNVRYSVRQRSDNLEDNSFFSSLMIWLRTM